MDSKKQNSRKAGLQFRRRFTKDDVNVFDQFEYDYRTSIIRNPRSFQPATLLLYGDVGPVRKNGIEVGDQQDDVLRIRAGAFTDDIAALVGARAVGHGVGCP